MSSIHTLPYQVPCTPLPNENKIDSYRKRCCNLLCWIKSLPGKINSFLYKLNRTLRAHTQCSLCVKHKQVYSETLLKIKDTLWYRQVYGSKETTPEQKLWILRTHRIQYSKITHIYQYSTHNRSKHTWSTLHHRHKNHTLKLLTKN
jgi:hypothetical protein